MISRPVQLVGMEEYYRQKRRPIKWDGHRGTSQLHTYED